MTEMTPEQAREHHLSRIRDYVKSRGIKGEDIALIFEAGIAAAHRLAPAILGQPAKDNSNG